MQKRFHGVSKRNSANHNDGRRQVVYDDDIFGENTVAEKSVVQSRVAPAAHRRMDQPIVLVGPMPTTKRYVRQQQFHPYQRPPRNVPSTNGCQVNGTQASTNDNEYKLVKKIGHGTYGEVFKGIRTKTNQPVAIKRLICKIKSVCSPTNPSNHFQSFLIVIFLRGTGATMADCFPRNRIAAITEGMQKCRSADGRTQIAYTTATPSIESGVRILPIRIATHHLQQEDQIHIARHQGVAIAIVRRTDIHPSEKGECTALMVLHLESAISYSFRSQILHRDIKTENILLSAEGRLKIADFGLSRAIIECLDKRVYTVNVVTLWYRAPELLFGDTGYSTAVDLWSAGCVMAEFWTRVPIMQGNSERQQLTMISDMCGTISTAVWPDVVRLQLFRTLRMKTGQRCKTRDFLFDRSKCGDGSDLFKSLLTLDPKKRITAFVAQNHDFFWMEPLPSDLRDFMTNIRNNNCGM